MFAKLTALMAPAGARPGEVAQKPSVFHAPFRDRVGVLDRDPYLCVADIDRGIISVFDDLKYDRADLDALSGPMRSRALTKLTPLGFRQVSGHRFENADEDIKIHLPKFRALGASPFDAMHELELRAQDFAILTPTQTACQFIDAYPIEDAVERIKELMSKHPINLLRIFDFLERKPAHEAFRETVGHLKFVQRTAVEAEPLRSRRALR